MNSNDSIDLGYSWIWTYGHLAPAGLFLCISVIVWLVAVPVWGVVACLMLTLWFFAGFCVSRFLFRFNAPGLLPTSEFLSKDSGKILDIGCGSGRSSIMVGQARPGVEIVALDNFSADYIANHSEENTLRNFEIAGIAERATFRESDMRSLPFEHGSFDAAVSSAAIDHLTTDDIQVVLSEVHRVLRQNGEFLLMVIVPNFWTVLAYGPFIFSAFSARTFWRYSLQQAGFSLTREGSIRGCAWFLLQKSATEPVTVSSTEASSSPDMGQLSHNHSFTLSGLFVPVMLTGIVMLLIAAAIEFLGLGISWWWLAAAVPIAMHFGVILMMGAALLKWLSRVWA